jgi:hypothetical protein
LIAMTTWSSFGSWRSNAKGASGAVAENAA